MAAVVTVRTIHVAGNYAATSMQPASGDADADRRAGPEEPEDADEVRAGERDAAVRRVPGVDMQEDRRPPARHDGRVVVADDREQPVGRRDPPERLAAAAERRRRPARDVPKPVVGVRARILVPPVAADEPVVPQADARIGVEAVDDGADPERAERRRAVALAVVRRDAVAPDAGAPRPE